MRVTAVFWAYCGFRTIIISSGSRPSYSCFSTVLKIFNSPSISPSPQSSRGNTVHKVISYFFAFYQGGPTDVLHVYCLLRKQSYPPTVFSPIWRKTGHSPSNSMPTVLGNQAVARQSIEPLNDSCHSPAGCLKEMLALHLPVSHYITGVGIHQGTRLLRKLKGKNQCSIWFCVQFCFNPSL